MSLWKRVVGFSSSSGWESSYYGGYHKVLNDYPEISAPFKLDWDPIDRTKQKLDWYEWNKLCKLFLLEVKETDLQSAITMDIEVTEHEKWGKKYKRHTLNSARVNTVLTSICNRNRELTNMFVHYRKEIDNTIFYFDQEEDDKNGDCDIDGTKYFQELIGDVEKRENKKWLYGNSLSEGDLKLKTKFKTMKIRSACEYTSEERLYSDQLLNLLDISFNPASDRINNLKAGALDGRKICEIQGGNTNVYYRVEENQTTRPFSVCILADESGSMGVACEDYRELHYKLAKDPRYQPWNRLNYQVQLVKILYRTFARIVPQEKLFIYGHSGSDTPRIYVYHDKYNHTFEQTIDHMSVQNQNYDGPVIETVYEKVRSFTDDNIIFISISDGEPGGTNYGGYLAIETMKRVIEKCKRDGFVTCGIGINHEVDHIYNYHANIQDVPRDLVKKTSMLINHMVKTEFQD